MKIFKLLFFITFLLATTACSEDELSANSVIDAQSSHQQFTALDQWIEDSITMPYGIAVEYRWNKYTSPIQGYTTPPDTANIRQVLRTIKELWIDLYTSSNTGGKDFLRDKKPLKMYLFGGPNIDPNGVERLNNPNATNIEMYIFNVNSFTTSDYKCVYKLMRSVHHQFAKRLMEVFPFDRTTFSSFSKHWYTDGSTDFIEKRLKYMKDEMELYRIVNYGLIHGMFTYYSFLSGDDDFAEMVSVHLMHTPKEISQSLEHAREPHNVSPEDEFYEEEKKKAEQRYQELTAKREIMLDFFKKEVDISMNVLQKHSLKKLNRYK